MTSSVDIVIVSYNTRDDLLNCLRSLLTAPPARLGRIIVVDNASGDGSLPAVKTEWPAVETIALDRNVGFAAANNVALRQATAALVLLLNSDTIVPPGAVDRLVERLNATGATAAGPRLVDRDGRPEVSFGRMLSPLAELAQAIRGKLARSRSRAAQSYIRRLASREREVDWVSGACLLVRRAEAAAAGLLDERYFMYEEDVDFCAALRAQGGRILFTPAVEITHIRGRSPSSAGRQHYDRSHLAFYEKHRPGWAPVLRLWQRLLGRSVR